MDAPRKPTFSGAMDGGTVMKGFTCKTAGALVMVAGELTIPPEMKITMVFGWADKTEATSSS